MPTPLDHGFMDFRRVIATARHYGARGPIMQLNGTTDLVLVPIEPPEHYRNDNFTEIKFT